MELNALNQQFQKLNQKRREIFASTTRAPHAVKTRVAVWPLCVRALRAAVCAAERARAPQGGVRERRTSTNTLTRVCACACGCGC